MEARKEFPQENELAEKVARLGELNALLDMDKKDHIVMEEEEIDPEREKAAWVREKMRYRGTGTVVHSLKKCGNRENAQSSAPGSSDIVGGRGGRKGYEDRRH